jgi:cell division protein FtsB
MNASQFNFSKIWQAIQWKQKEKFSSQIRKEYKKNRRLSNHNKTTKK